MPSTSEPMVAEYTPRAPFTVGLGEPLGNARRLMGKYGLRALPVRAEGKIVGLLAEGDLDLVWRLMNPPPDGVPVESAMKPEPYTVESIATLGEVIRAMTARHADAAVVLEAGRVVGVFTAEDAMRALVDALEGKLVRDFERSRSSRAPPTRARGRLSR